LGQFDSGFDGAFALLPATQGDHVDILQVVVAAGSKVNITAELFGSSSRDGVPVTIPTIPIPEPVTASLLAGLGGVALLRRRR
jgi:hypothetical protein